MRKALLATDPGSREPLLTAKGGPVSRRAMRLPKISLFFLCYGKFLRAEGPKTSQKGVWGLGFRGHMNPEIFEVKEMVLHRSWEQSLLGLTGDASQGPLCRRMDGCGPFGVQGLEVSIPMQDFLLRRQWGGVFVMAFLLWTMAMWMVMTATERHLSARTLRQRQPQPRNLLFLFFPSHFLP